ncbi:MAG: ABC transporter ATP-binding protein, partial [Gaiellaceae bacterium]
MADPDKPTTPGMPRRVARLFRPYRWQVSAVVAMILVTAGLGVAPSLLTKVVFDRALFPTSGHRDLHLLYILVALMVVIPLVA